MECNFQDCWWCVVFGCEVLVVVWCILVALAYTGGPGVGRLAGHLLRLMNYIHHIQSKKTVVN